MRTSVVLAVLMCAQGCAGAPSRGASGPQDVARSNEAGAEVKSESLPSSPSTAVPVAAVTGMAMADPGRAVHEPSAAAPAAPTPSSSSPATSTIATAPPASPAVIAKPARPEMLDIEANLSIEVEAVPAAASALRAAAKKFDGIIVEDTVNEQPSGATARLTIRVPSQRAEVFLDSLDGVGRVRSRQISARDIGKEYFDAELKLETLSATIKRYEEILKQAKDVNEILRVEGELSRLRGEVEQTKGNLRWLGDRAARATVHVNLAPVRHEVTLATPDREPEVKFYPGLRLSELTDFRGDAGTTSYLGGGFSVNFSRQFGVHLDGLREGGTGSPTRGLDVVLLSLGGEMFSDFLGGGRRKFLNPYLGYNLGYARFTGHNEGFAGVTAGVELWKSKTVVLDAQARAFVLVFGSDGSHVAVQPVLRASIAF